MGVWMSPAQPPSSSSSSFLSSPSTTEGRLQTHASTFSEETRVRFSVLSEELVWEHVLSGEPM